jgi:hypothetical protein
MFLVRQFCGCFFTCFEKFCFPINYMGRIKQLLKESKENEEGGDDIIPIVQVPVLVTGDKGTVYIDILPSHEEDQQPGMVVGAGVGFGNNGI